MFGALLITLREGLEAALIIGIILAYLARTNNRQGFKPVWLGTSLAVVASLIAGAIIYVVAGEFEGRAEQIFEGTTILLAVGVLTWMIFWMRKQAANIRGELQAQIQSALTSGSSFALGTIAFVAVVREGIETVLFLFAANKVAESAASFTIGGLLGLAIAVAIGYGIYKGTAGLNLKTFFNITGLVLIIFAAGLLAASMGEYHEAGIIPPVIEHTWDINNVINEESTVGQFLKAIFGYRASPSLVQVIAYIVYLAWALIAYFRPAAKPVEVKASAMAK